MQKKTHIIRDHQRDSSHFEAFCGKRLLMESAARLASVATCEVCRRSWNVPAK